MPRKSARLALQSLEAREVPSATVTGPSSSQSPYLVPSNVGVVTTSLLTVGDAADGYRMVGIPDGLGAYGNGDGTFTVLMNHELANTLGTVRDHGAVGSFVSKWVINKETLEVVRGDDLIKTVYLWDPAANGYVVGTGALAALNRLCSADLPAPTAFFNPATGLGTHARIFMNGEETSNGRAFAHVVTGPDAGQSWELPWAGKYAWENHVTSPFPQDRTVVVGLDDSRREFSAEGATEPSEVYVWVGQKQAAGPDVDKAGLRHGILHGLRVGTPGAYDANEGTVASGERFELVALFDQTNNTTFAPLQAEAITRGVTQFRRVEDGHFDPTDPDVFYFVTTDAFAGRTRLWKLTFDDITNPAAGGVIEVAVDSPAGVPGEMFDNVTVNRAGDVLLQEDPGNNPYLAQVWQWDAPTGELVPVARHDPARFGAAGIDLYPDIPGVQATQDEESSGIIDVSDILGPGKYLADVQAHYRFTAATDPTGELVEAGQFLLIDTSAPAAALEDGVLTVEGTIDEDALAVTRWGQTLTVTDGFRVVGSFKARDVDTVIVKAGAGNDVVFVAPNVHQDAVLLGGSGNDLLTDGGGTSILIGGLGEDWLFGGSKSDILIGGTTTHDNDDDALLDVLAAWNGPGNYAQRRAAVGAWLDETTVIDDAAPDRLFGLGAQDLFFAGDGDWTDARSNETVN